MLNIKSLIECGEITERKFKNPEIVSQLKLNGSVANSRRGTIKYINLAKEKNIFLMLKNHDYNIDSIEDIDSYIKKIFDNKASRDIIQKYHNDSKKIPSKSMRGLYISSLQKIDVILNGEAISILSYNGLGYFFFYTEKIELYEDTIVVGVENYQVIWFAKRYKKFFNNPNILFVAKTPYMLKWIKTLKNEYIHFGDCDLSGIHIYLNTMLPRLLKAKKTSMFIPRNIEELIKKHGNSELYEKQKQYKENLLTNDEKINHLIEVIVKYKKVIEQEGLSLLRT